MFVVSIILIIIVLFCLFKKIKAYVKNTGKKSFYKKLFANIASFITGTLFWVLFILLLLELTLHIIGYIYQGKEIKNNFTKDNQNTITIMCIGDSFTYGVGSTMQNDYPSVLQRLIQTQTHKSVNVYNFGRCAQNSTQVIENLQQQLKTTNPDIVVMLFGMANSWNYYGFKENNFLNSFKTYYLYKRIKTNIEFLGENTDTRKNVERHAMRFLLKSLKYPLLGHNSYYKYYYAGRYCLALQKWEEAMQYFAMALEKQNNIEAINALKESIEKYDINVFFSKYQGEYQNTVVTETIDKLNSLINKYQNKNIQFIKFLYLIDKNNNTYYDKIELTWLPEYRQTLLNKNFSYDTFLLIKKSFLQNKDSINLFCKINSLENIDSIKKIYEQNIYDYLFNLKTSIINYNISQILSLIDSSFISNYYSFFNPELTDNYYLPHNLKRTKKLETDKVFKWITEDIELAIQICLKQNYPVICMNYPLIPPPNSFEISFWADSVGKIWKYTANKYQVPFINNDSIFNLFGNKKSDYFEPYKIGSEHCNNKGYYIMAENIYKTMQNKYSFVIQK